MEEERKEEETLNPEDLMAMWEEALREASAKTSQEASTPPQPSFQEAQEVKPEKTSPTGLTATSPGLQELSPKTEGIHPELEFILDIPLEISVEIGRTKMLIRDLLKLNQGSVIELEKLAGEPVEIYVNGKLMAKGEVVVVNERFGVRIVEIISAQERIRKLGS